MEEAAADDQGLYFVIELLRSDVLFSSGVWTPVGDLPAMHLIYDATASTDSLFVTGTAGSGFFISTDHGATWRRPEDGIPAGEPVWALVTVGGRVFAGTQREGVFISDDGGETWAASNLGLAAIGPDCPGDPGAAQSQILDIAGFGSTVFVVGFCGVSRSDDLGETWREINEGLPDHFGSTSLAVGDGVAYVSSPEWHVYRLDWEHDRWEPVSGEVELPKTQVKIEDSLIAASTAGLRRSTDGGKTWEDVSVSPGRPVQDLAVSDGFIFALPGIHSTAEGVFWSSDLGDTWHPYNTSDLPDVFDLEVQGDRLFAIGRRGVFSAPLPDQLPSPATTAPGEVPEGFQIFDGSADGFLIALPDGWLVIDATVGDQDSIAAELEKIYPPDIAETVSSSFLQARKTEGSASGLVMAAFDADGDPNLTVTVSSRTPDDTLESWEDTLRTGTEASGGTVNSIDRLEVSGREALRIAALFPHEFGTSEIIQYIVLSEDTTYNITLSSAQPGAHVDLFVQAIDTFTIADA
jgi:hypothetical protein